MIVTYNRQNVFIVQATGFKPFFVCGECCHPPDPIKIISVFIYYDKIIITWLEHVLGLIILFLLHVEKRS
jgi:hypothetical protein